MNIWTIILSNPYLNCALLSWFLAQFIKGILNIITTKELRLERFFGNGGMPSSHSAFTVALAVSIMRGRGFHSPEFAIAFAFSAVVLTDAVGVRRAAGEQARVLNRLVIEIGEFPWFTGKANKAIEVPIDLLEEVEKAKPEEESEETSKEESLKEYIGHTPLEVASGCLLGIIIALLMPLG